MPDDFFEPDPIIEEPGEVLVDQPTAEPTQKVAAVGIAGAFSTLLIFAAGQAGIEVTPEVAAAFVTILSFGSGYFKRNKATDN